MSVMMINKAAFCALVAVVLSGCGGREPTEQDIGQAVDEMVAQTNQEMKQKVGTLFNVDLDMSLPLVGNKKETVNFTFIQEDGVWKLVK